MASGALPGQVRDRLPHAETGAAPRIAIPRNGASRPVPDHAPPSSSASGSTAVIYRYTSIYIPAAIQTVDAPGTRPAVRRFARCPCRSEEHTSELQSRENLVCRLLLE